MKKQLVQFGLEKAIARSSDDVLGEGSSSCTPTLDY